MAAVRGDREDVFDFSELLLYRLLGLGEINPEQCRGFLERYHG